MKKIVVIFLLLFVSIYLKAQQYHVGTPVYDTLIRYGASISPSPLLCFGHQLKVDTNLTDKISGINCYLLITASNFPTDSLKIIGHGTINAGDSILLTHNSAYVADGAATFQFANQVYGINGTISYAIIAEGIPTQAGGHFVCKPDIGGSAGIMVDGCNNAELVHFARRYGDTSFNCTVAPPLPPTGIGGTNTPLEKIVLAPNPSVSFCSLELTMPQRTNATVQIVDNVGKILWQNTLQLNPGLQKLSLPSETLPTGDYWVVVRTASSSDKRILRWVKE